MITIRFKNKSDIQITDNKLATIIHNKFINMYDLRNDGYLVEVWYDCDRNPLDYMYSFKVFYDKPNNKIHPIHLLPHYIHIFNYYIHKFNKAHYKIILFIKNTLLVFGFLLMGILSIAIIIIIFKVIVL